MGVLGFDYVGVAAIISALFAGIATLVGAIVRRATSGIQRGIDTGDDPRTLGEIARDLASQLDPPEPKRVDPPDPPRG